LVYRDRSFQRELRKEEFLKEEFNEVELRKEEFLLCGRKRSNGVIFASAGFFLMPAHKRKTLNF
jgi:hypothetical protein